MKVGVLDLFCGAGGLSMGFAREGFDVTGSDINPYAKQIFDKNRIGRIVLKDLSIEKVKAKCEVVIGGPPCRPWSTLNITRRLDKHFEYGLVERFFEHVLEIYPLAFLMENVTRITSDEMFKKWMNILTDKGYSVDFMKIRYSDYGAATKRRRLILVGFRNGIKAEEFFKRLEEMKKSSRTVRDAIAKYERMGEGEFPDHVWPKLRTIKKYERYYRTGKYGWYRLHYDSPAPSFGNIMKTYILHPMAGINGIPQRVISVREAMAIMGFDDSFAFPDGMGMSLRYQMIADAVSPIFSRTCARVFREMIQEDRWLKER